MRAFAPIVRFAVAAAALIGLGAVAPAQDLRDQTIRIIVPFPAGGTADTIARLVAQHATEQRGQKVIVENRPGAGTIIGTDAVARAAPDGTTVLIMSNSFVINPIVRAQLPYDPMAMEPVCNLVDSPQVLVVHEGSPYRTLRDLLDAAKARPGALSYASVGPATTQHIAGEMLKLAAGINLTYVPYTGGAPAVNALLGQHVTAVIGNYNEAAEQIHSGKLRALAVASRQRLNQLPEVPTFIEQGFAEFETSAFFGVVAPPKTPQPALDHLGSLLKAALADRDVAAKMTGQGFDIIGECGAPFRAHIQRQYDNFAKAIRASGIKAE